MSTDTDTIVRHATFFGVAVARGRTQAATALRRVFERQYPGLKLSLSVRRNGPALVGGVKGFDPEKHPRGQPENAGQFASSPSTSNAPKRPTVKPSAPAKENVDRIRRRREERRKQDQGERTVTGKPKSPLLKPSADVREKVDRLRRHHEPGQRQSSSVPGYPRLPTRNGRDPDASGLSPRGGKAQNVRPWNPDEAAGKIAPIVKAIPKGEWTQGNATQMERVVAHVLNFDHWGETFPADVAGAVKCKDGKARRVGLDVKTAISRSDGGIKRDDNAEIRKVQFTQAGFDAKASLSGNKNAGTESLMFFLGINANGSVREVPELDANGRVRKVNGQPVMKPAGLLYLEAGVQGSNYKNMTPIDVEGLSTVADLANPEILAKVREKILDHIRSTDPATFQQDVTAAAQNLADKKTKRDAKDYAVLDQAGAVAPDNKKKDVELGKALISKEQAQKAAREAKKALAEKEKALADLAASNPTMAKKLREAGLIP